MSTPARILLVTGDTQPAAPSSGQILLYAKTDGTFYSLNSADVETPLGGGGGGVPSFSGGTTGLTPNTPTTGAITLGGVLSVANGGTGATTQSGAANSILPSQAGNAGKFLTTDGSVVSWATVTGTGTVTSVTVNGTEGRITSSGSPITTSGSITLDLATSGVTANTYGSATQVPVFTVDAYGRVTSVTNTAISVTAGVSSFSAGTTGLTPNTATTGAVTLAGTLGIANGGTGATTASAAINALLPSQTGNSGRFLTTNGTTASWAVVSGTGTVTSVGVSGANGIGVSGSPITTSGTISLSLGAITPTSVAATGTVTGSNLSGTNTGDQTITLTGDVTGSGTGSFATTLANSGVTAGTYGSATQVPQLTVDAKGRITSVSNVTITGGGGSTSETVVFHYTSGGSGNLTAVDAIVSQTSGVTATITDGANCLVNFVFSGKSAPPISVTIYGQNYTANTFSMVTLPAVGAALANFKIAGGGTSASPDLANGIFSASNIVTLQLRMSDTGASSTIGNRAYAIVRFGF